MIQWRSNGCGAFLAWTSHYNGQGELSKHTAMAKARIKSIFYKNERSLSFEKVMVILSKSFSTLDKDPDERYSECQKVEKLLQCIQMPGMEVVAQKSVIASQYADDFSGTCNYFSAQVSRLHGGAQLENSKYTKRHKVSAMYGCGGQDGGHSGGHGRFGGRPVAMVMTGQVLLMALMYQTRLKTLRMKNGGNLRIMVDGCIWLRLVNE
jgi:hypothetical protein